MVDLTPHFDIYLGVGSYPLEAAIIVGTLPYGRSSEGLPLGQGGWYGWALLASKLEYTLKDNRGVRGFVSVHLVPGAKCR